jgi:predicted transcriptional regulator
MTVHVTVPLDEAQNADLERIAQHENLSVPELMASLVRSRIEYDRWFRAEVQKGRDDVAAGRVMSNEEAMRRLDAHIAAREAARG